MGPVLVDVTRTLERAFKPIPTGIDRVERAYITWFSALPNTWFVATLSGRTVVLDASGLQVVLDRIDGKQPWHTPSGLGWLWSLSGDTTIKRNTTLKSAATWIFPKSAAAEKLSKHLDGPFTYINVGHTNLDEDWLVALKRDASARIVTMIHDMIPLDTPQFQTAASVQRFERRIRSAGAASDVIIANSAATAERVKAWFKVWNHGTRVEPIWLGVPAARPASARQGDSYFLMLGTIEPRKNHRVVLDAWHAMAPTERPILHIVGARGWENADVFETLDTSPLMGTSIFEHGPLPDDRTAALLAGSSGLLFPSLAEGFGLPVLEALQVGVPVLANRLPVIEELAGNSVLYIDSHDANTWATIITRIANSSGTPNNIPDIGAVHIPRWDDHFHTVMKLLH